MKIISLMGVALASVLCLSAIDTADARDIRDFEQRLPTDAPAPNHQIYDGSIVCFSLQGTEVSKRSCGDVRCETQRTNIGRRIGILTTAVQCSDGSLITRTAEDETIHELFRDSQGHTIRCNSFIGRGPHSGRRWCSIHQ